MSGDKGVVSEWVAEEELEGLTMFKARTAYWRFSCIYGYTVSMFMALHTFLLLLLVVCYTARRAARDTYGCSRWAHALTELSRL